jgi:hypothetical protein
MKARVLVLALTAAVGCGPVDSSRDVADTSPDTPEVEAMRTEIEPQRTDVEPKQEPGVPSLDSADAPADLPEGPDGFPWHRGWYTDGTSDWYTVRDDGRVLMSTAKVTVDPDSTIRGLVFELDISNPSAARSRPYASAQRWTEFVLTFEGDSTFLIDGTPFTYVETDLGDDFDVRADTPADRWGLFFLIDQLDANGESMPE